MSLPGDTLSALLLHLTPLTRYEVNVYAQYSGEQGDSLPVTGYETTLEGRLQRPSGLWFPEAGVGYKQKRSFTFVTEQGPVRNLRVSEETTNSFRVSWQRAPGAVLRYRLTYEPTGDESSRLETTTVGAETSIVLQQLQPQTTYRVSVTPEYSSGSGATLQTDGTTKDGENRPAYSRWRGKHVQLWLDVSEWNEMFVMV